MIQRYSSVIVFLLCWILRTESFSQNKNGRTTRVRHSPTSSTSITTSTSVQASVDGDSAITERRKFLSNTMGAVVTMAGISAMPNQALAQPTATVSPEPNKYGVASNKRLGGLANKIRNICNTMDEMQRDLMQERWDLVAQYPAQLRSYVPLLTAYTDSAFPSEAPSDWGLRVALRYEVGRYFGCLERLRSAVAKQNLNDAYIAYADMSLHLDRYLKVGGIYTFYDDVIDNEKYFDKYNDALVYSDPIKDPADVRDLVVLCKGPDKGKTGIVIGVYQDGSETCAVKMDRYKGMREIRVVPRSWAAKRLGEQDPDDVFLIPRKAT
mmetsp:Transcript_26906/g.65372  ORF Transcript_26906/g.65372 Transcript_26906/m.65372 type:complete len:324 (-) Transcript_26906:81-1052(-)